MKRKKLAITAISGNEEKWAKQWCDSVMKANPDYVVFNLTQYDDNTEQIIKSNIPSDKLTFVKYPWEKDFSKARNQGLQHLPDDVEYMFYIDLDETITEESYEALEDLLHQEENFIVLVNIYNALEQEGLVASLFYPRLVPLFFEGRKIEPRPYYEAEVHNQIIINKKIPVIRTPISIWHYGYALDKEAMKQKHKRSEDLLREQINKDNDSFFAHLNLAQLLRAKGDFEGTYKHAMEVLRIVEPKIKQGQKQYLHAFIMSKDQVATALLALRRVEEALPHIKDTIEVKPDHLDSIMNMGNAYMELRQHDKAEFWYKRYLFVRSNYDELKDNTNLILNHLNSSFIVLYNLGISRAMQGDMKGAVSYFEKGYKEEPTFKDIIIKYIHGLRILGENERIPIIVNNFLNEHPKKSNLIYEYYGDLALENCDMELAKFNYYQAKHLTEVDDEILKNRLDEKWKNIHQLFGEVSHNFFDTTKTKNIMANKVR